MPEVILDQNRKLKQIYEPERTQVWSEILIISLPLNWLYYLRFTYRSFDDNNRAQNTRFKLLV